MWWDNTGRDGYLSSRKGNLAIMTALMLPGFVGAVGLSVETAYWYYIQDRAQAAADISAYAGAIALRDESDKAFATVAAQSEASKLGYTSSTSVVSVNSPPTAGLYTSNDAVEVIISYEAPRFFSSIFTNAKITHAVRGVARYQEPRDVCILALDSTRSRSLSMFGNADLSAATCDLMSNSLADDAVYIDGASEAVVDCINSAGGEAVNPDSVTMACEEVRTRQSSAIDPYAGTTAPTSSTPCVNMSENKFGPTLVTPGLDGVLEFCNGLDLKGDVTFAPGVYIVDGGDFKINSTADIKGTGVTFFVKNGNNITFNGSAAIDLTAPTGGEYSGLLVWGDPDDTTSNHKLNGGADVSMTGTFYFPGTELELLGNAGVAAQCLQLIAGEIRFAGTADFSITDNCAGSGIKWAKVPGSVTLVE